METSYKNQWSLKNSSFPFHALPMAKREFQLCLLLSSSHSEMVYNIWCHIMSLTLFFDPYITCHLSVALFILPFDKIFGLLYTHTHHHPAPNCLEPPVKKKSKTSNPETESSTRSPQQRTLAVLEGHWQMAWSMLLLNVFSIPRWAKALEINEHGVSAMPQVTSMWVVPFISGSRLHTKSSPIEQK